MAYCAPPSPNCGFLDHGCALYGGIQIRANACSSAKPTQYYVPQFNLATYWQQPFLVPHSLGFPRVLARPLDWTSCESRNIPNRAPGHWNFDTPKTELRNRNLMAGCREGGDGDGDVVRLWTVNELSDRKTLTEFRVRRKEYDDGFRGDWEVLNGSADDRDAYEKRNKASARGMSEFGEELNQSSNPSRYSKHGGRGSGTKSGVLKPGHNRSGRVDSGSGMSSVDEEEDDIGASPVKWVGLPSPAVQLISWVRKGTGPSVLIRTERSICVWDSERGDIGKVYSSKVQSVSPMPYMDDELLLLDENSMVWFGGMERGCAKLSRVKCAGDVQLVSPSDHPRLIYVANANGVWIVDLRDGTSNGCVLYSVPEYDDTSNCGKYYCYEEAFPKPTIQHITAFNRLPRMLLVTSSNKFSVVDERMPNVCYIEQSHSIADGGDYICAAPPLTDLYNNGRVYPFYILRNVTLPDVQQIAFYEHSTGGQWSSLANMKRLSEPSDIAPFLRQQPKHGVRLSRSQHRRLLGDGPTRAIHIEEWGGRLALFRMMSDGSVWYDEVGIEDDRNREEQQLERDVEIVRRMVAATGADRGPIWEEGVDESLLQQPDSLVRHYDIEGSMTSSMDDERSLERLGNPMRTELSGGHPPWEPPADSSDSDHILSDVVLNCWERYK